MLRRRQRPRTLGTRITRASVAAAANRAAAPDFRRYVLEVYPITAFPKARQRLLGRRRTERREIAGRPPHTEPPPSHVVGFGGASVPEANLRLHL